ncbi:head-tail connector protein [Aestuariivirga sp.]|uniref:head-tail connector protein n=1 Tax=Aestuariivirga sp. TaxID=2650926 RepID=UPI0025BCD309|nr:head-tail connector protein [Aestuariivirga sp.]MCA3555303.1 phage head-tail connector protein [Aestuariivirga sp.]
MGQVLVQAPASEPVSLAEAKAQLRVVNADDDQLIASLVTAARRVVEARTGLSLIAQDWLCFRDQWPGDGAIELPVAPLRAVEEIAVFGEDDAKAVIDPAHYFADAASRPPRVLLRGSREWPRPGRAANGIAIRAEAGFGTSPQDVPQPLRQAILLLVAHFYAQRGEEAGSGVPLTLNALLEPYRMVRL